MASRDFGLADRAGGIKQGKNDAVFMLREKGWLGNIVFSLPMMLCRASLGGSLRISADLN